MMRHLLMICFLCVGHIVFSQSHYCDSVLLELRKQWPDNRTVNFVFHGHSVPSGYAQTPNVTLLSYPHQFHRLLKDRFPYAVVNVITTSIGGEQSEQGALRMRREVLCHRPDVLFIDYALNDRYIGIECAEKAWRGMIEEALAVGCRVVLLTPTPDTAEDLLNPDAPLEQHAAQIRRLANEYRVGLVDSYKAFQQLARNGADINGYMSQNNHPNERGHAVVAGELIKYLGVE